MQRKPIYDSQVENPVHVNLHVSAIHYAQFSFTAWAHAASNLRQLILYKFGPRLCKSRRDRTEVYNGPVPWATWP